MIDVTTLTPDTQIVQTAWRTQSVWSETANKLKTDLFRWRRLAAMAGVVGAVLETLAATLTGLLAQWAWVQSGIALLGALILGIIPYVVKTKLTKEREQAWIMTRAASEALKKAIYTYLVSGDKSAPATLTKQCQEITDKVEAWSPLTATVMPKEKANPLTLTPQDYVAWRVTEQIEKFYLPRGREKAQAAQLLQNLEFWLGLLATIMGLLAAAASTTGFTALAALSPWIAVVTTAGAAVTAHLAALRYSREAMIYLKTGNRLEGLRNNWMAAPNRMETAVVAKFVEDCEQTISTENEAWLAEWSQAPKAAKS